MVTDKEVQYTFQQLPAIRLNLFAYTTGSSDAEKYTLFTGIDNHLGDS